MKYTTQIISSSLIALSLLTSINTNAQRVVKCADGSLVTAISLCPASDAVQSGGYNANPDSKPSSRFGSPIYNSSKIDSGTIGISNSTSPALNGTIVSRVKESMNMIDPRTRINNGTLSTNSSNRRNTQPIFTDRNKKLKPANTNNANSIVNQSSWEVLNREVNGYQWGRKVGNTYYFTKFDTTLKMRRDEVLSINGNTVKIDNVSLKTYVEKEFRNKNWNLDDKVLKNWIDDYTQTAISSRNTYIRQFRITNTNNNRQLPSPATRSLSGNRTTNAQPTNKPTSDNNIPIVNKPVNNTPAPCVSITTPNDGFRYPTATDGTGCPTGTKLP